MTRRFVHRRLIAAVASTVAFEAAAILIVAWFDVFFWLLLAVASHLLATRLALAAARCRRRLSVTEEDTVLATAFFIPLWGPVLAFSLPRPPLSDRAPLRIARYPGPDTALETSPKDVFKRYEEHVRPRVPHFQRSLFSGDFDRDLARELDLESYSEVLRRGSIDQKRNALSRLADLSEPRHLTLVRSCLLDPSHEVRLYAYAELERVAARFEDAIDERGKELLKDPSDQEATLALADAHYHYASSGVLDPSMASYHFRLSLKRVQSFTGRKDSRPWVLRALNHLGLKELDLAEKDLSEVPSEHSRAPAVLIARAMLAYTRRDFTKARDQAEILERNKVELPPWLKALLLSTGEATATSTEISKEISLGRSGGLTEVDRQEAVEPWHRSLVDLFRARSSTQEAADSADLALQTFERVTRAGTRIKKRIRALIADKSLLPLRRGRR